MQEKRAVNLENITKYTWISAKRLPPVQVFVGSSWTRNTVTFSTISFISISSKTQTSSSFKSLSTTKSAHPLVSLVPGPSRMHRTRHCFPLETWSVISPETPFRYFSANLDGICCRQGNRVHLYYLLQNTIENHITECRAKKITRWNPLRT